MARTIADLTDSMQIGLEHIAKDILKVQGIGQKFWDANKDLITVGEEGAKVVTEKIK